MTQANVTPIRVAAVKRQATNARRRAKRVTVSQARTIGQVIASAAGAFLPVASYVEAHVEAATNVALYALVAAALAFSAPTLAGWARRWTHSPVKAWGFTLLLEGTMTASHLLPLSLAALAFLVAINAQSAWVAFGKSGR